jgi:hypothetical protein
MALPQATKTDWATGEVPTAVWANNLGINLDDLDTRLEEVNQAVTGSERGSDFSTSSTSYVDTGFSATMTPRGDNVLVMLAGGGGMQTGANEVTARIYVNGTGAGTEMLFTQFSHDRPILMAFIVPVTPGVASTFTLRVKLSLLVNAIAIESEARLIAIDLGSAT